VAIVSFRCSETRAAFETGKSKRFANILSALRGRLLRLDEARALDDLSRPPGNRLEPLRGNRAGQHSIRVNAQFRVCFRWTPDGPADVECVDYH
jgi:toxin HigB-1